ncbi:uncharacterized protein [Primulina huaijiensis]|uniref:uncharacterized protein n=1 Tax=Primulina huaijiensis TaxID=1492673 RepID=UPI003CC6F867
MGFKNGVCLVLELCSMCSPVSTYSLETNFAFSELLEFNGCLAEETQLSLHYLKFMSQNSNSMVNDVDDVNLNGSNNSFHESYTDRESNEQKKAIREKIAFKTKSDIEILVDSFKWRKYGKKMVKNYPNPRFHITS